VLKSLPATKVVTIDIEGAMTLRMGLSNGSIAFAPRDFAQL
jgi:hypothetical protein